MTRGNPLFPYVYRIGQPIFDRLFYHRYRRAALAHATGRLLMGGLGPGTDLKFVPSAVTSVTAVEPAAAFPRMAPLLPALSGAPAPTPSPTAQRIPAPHD